jgi:hypothetical protein
MLYLLVSEALFWFVNKDLYASTVDKARFDLQCQGDEGRTLETSCSFSVTPHSRRKNISGPEAVLAHLRGAGFQVATRLPQEPSMTAILFAPNFIS